VPRYQFGCNDCDATRDVIADFVVAQDLELVCVRCGGVMTAKPVTAVNYIKSRSQGEPAAAGAAAGGATAQRKDCGHSYHCRCAIRLTKPNPFADKIREAAGEGDA
jgi:hypothetical protein